MSAQQLRKRTSTGILKELLRCREADRAPHNFAAYFCSHITSNRREARDCYRPSACGSADKTGLRAPGHRPRVPGLGPRATRLGPRGAGTRAMDPGPKVPGLGHRSRAQASGPGPGPGPRARTPVLQAYRCERSTLVFEDYSCVLLGFLHCPLISVLRVVLRPFGFRVH